MKQIPLTQGKTVLVDDKWYTVLSQWEWYFDGSYACRDIGTKEEKEKVFMHRFICMAPKCYQVDHKNQNKLDCQSNNLRVIKPAKNYLNRKMLSNNKSGYKGVCWDKSRGKYTAHIQINKKQHNLGRFTSAKEAAKEYNKAAIKLHGEFAYLNNV